MSRSASITAATIATALSTACGGGDTNKGDTTASTNQFFQTVAKASCEWEYRCCSDDALKAREGAKHTDVTSCIPYQQLAFESLLYAGRLQIKRGRVRLDDALAQDCIAALEAQPCEQPNTHSSNPTVPFPSPCFGVFDGLGKDGEECDLSFTNECERHARCIPASGNNVTGVCVRLQQENDICNTSDDCDPLFDPAVVQDPQSPFSFTPVLYCSAKDFKCHTRSKIGDACSTYPMSLARPMNLPPLSLCEADAYCDGTTCKHLPQSGETCAIPTTPEQPFPCDPDPMLNLSCAITMTVPNVTVSVCKGPGKLGDPCMFGIMPCDAGLVCDPSMFPSTCSMPKMKDEMCRVSFECAMGLFCDNQSIAAIPTCQPAKNDGEPCIGGDNAECISGVCTGPPNGGPPTCTQGQFVPACSGR